LQDKRKLDYTTIELKAELKNLESESLPHKKGLEVRQRGLKPK